MELDDGFEVDDDRAAVSADEIAEALLEQMRPLFEAMTVALIDSQTKLFVGFSKVFDERQRAQIDLMAELVRLLAENAASNGGATGAG